MSSSTEVGPLRLGARRSPLARAQVEWVAARLRAIGVDSVFVGLTTRGDVDYRDLTEIGGTGIFATAVRDALARGEIDVAVHSLKDLPTAPAPGLEICAIPEREDARDVLVGRRLADLVDGSRIGTGAPRRAVQLQTWAERAGVGIEIVPVRGNVDTRIELARTGEVDAVVLAAAGLRRLGHLRLSDKHTTSDTVVSNLPAEVIAHEVLLPAPGQGALALEIHHSLSIQVRGLVERLDDPASRAEALVERGFLAALEAGCTAPVGARARVKSVRGKDVDLTLNAVIGKTLLSNVSELTKAASTVRWVVSGSTRNPAEFGAAQGRQALASLPE